MYCRQFNIDYQTIERINCIGAYFDILCSVSICLFRSWCNHFHIFHKFANLNKLNNLKFGIGHKNMSQNPGNSLETCRTRRINRVRGTKCSLTSDTFHKQECFGSGSSYYFSCKGSMWTMMSNLYIMRVCTTHKRGDSMSLTIS